MVSFKFGIRWYCTNKYFITFFLIYLIIFFFRDLKYFFFETCFELSTKTILSCFDYFRTIFNSSSLFFADSQTTQLQKIQTNINSPSIRYLCVHIFPFAVKSSSFYSCRILVYIEIYYSSHLTYRTPSNQIENPIFHIYSLFFSSFLYNI